MRENWQSTFGGSGNANKIAVLEEGMKYTPIGISPEQAQFLETRKFQINEVVTDAIGNHTNTWGDYWSCAAYANLASGKEYGAAGQTLGSDTLVFEVRWCERLRDLDSTKYRILFGGSIYNIVTVDDVQFRHEKLKLTAQRERR